MLQPQEPAAGANVCPPLLELAPPGQAATLARQIQQVAERNPRDEIQLDYDQVRLTSHFLTCILSHVFVFCYCYTNACILPISFFSSPCYSLVQLVCGLRYLVHAYLQRITKRAMPVLQSTFQARVPGQSLHNLRYFSDWWQRHWNGINGIRDEMTAHDTKK